MSGDRAPYRKRRVSTSQIIATAVVLVGSEDIVRERMQCSEEDFAAFRHGTREPHWRKVSDVLWLCMEAQRKLIAENKRKIAEIKLKLHSMG